jgi:hypothetical protein
MASAHDGPFPARRQRHATTRLAAVACLVGLGAGCVETIDKERPTGVMVQARPGVRDAASEVVVSPGPSDAARTPGASEDTAGGAGEPPREADAAPAVDASGADAPGVIVPSPFPTIPTVPPSLPPPEPPPPGTPKPCIAAGSPCEPGLGTCCGRGAFCFKGGLETVCVADCTRSSDCSNGCCATLATGKRMCAPENLCEGDAAPPATDARPAAPADMSTSCGRLVVRAADGRFLGVATSDPSVANGVCNKASPHGNTTGTDSLFNKAGIYGNPASTQSAYHPTTTTPPSVRCESSDRQRWWVTKNRAITTTPSTRIDPDALCRTLADNFL